MKNLKIVLAALLLLAISCTHEYGGSTNDSIQMSQNGRIGEIGPENATNPFDSAGRAYGEIIEILYGSKIGAQSIEAIAARVDSTAGMHPEWGLQSASASLSGKIPALTILVNSGDPLEVAIGTSGLGTGAKLSLSGFVNLLSLHKVEPYEDIRALAVDYESGVLNNIFYTDQEKRSLLVAASVARYSAYRKKRKDKDWETSVSIAGAVAGSDEDISLAVRMAAAVGIYRASGVTE